MAADFDEPVFDDDFVRSAAFTEPSALERARPPSRRERRRSRRAARRAGLGGAGVGGAGVGGAGVGGGRFARRGGGRRDPSHRRAVVQLVAGLLVLFAISFALWWWNSASRDERPVRPIVPTITDSPPSPAPTTAKPSPSAIPEV
ncbi:hypothetical protein [Actinomadura decatromicini]|uniref:Uncharacterized protein n=1 Tax=Actinomadura decatromicini TaxID=2604572 RepID=A0A5D3FLG6_9ACTN|nr:hypothetical protein [Actinomadura decatromicini]TYK48974.1 hypothetical protein FXF68_14090 [Actinomadura decatromicini]